VDVARLDPREQQLIDQASCRRDVIDQEILSFHRYLRSPSGV
jgi:hypothetical protein